MSESIISQNAQNALPLHEQFCCVNCNDVNMMENVTIEKNKKIFEIRKEGKRFWIKCDGVIIKYPFAINQYRTTEGSGTFVVNVSDGLRNTVRLIDKFVQDEFDRLYLNKICDNIMLTKGALQDMFRNSLYNDTLRISVSDKNCGFFKSDNSKISSPMLSDILKEDAKCSIMIEPAFVWMVNKKIGIHWDARQIKLHPLQFNIIGKASSPSLFHGNVKKQDDANVNANAMNAIDAVQKSLSKLELNTTKFVLPQKGSFKNMFDDE
jgi:hypothetical protein